MKGWMLLVGGLLASGAWAQVPKIDELAGNWLDTKEILNFPSVTNTHGAVRCGANLTEFYHGNFPPLSQAGSTAGLTVDERPVAAQRFRWFPYQVVRSAKMADGLALESVTRLGANQNQILILLTVKNEGRETLKHEIAVTHKGGFRLCDVVWDWNNRGIDPGGFGLQLFPDHLLLKDSQSPGVVTVRALPKPISQGSATAWNLELKPGQSRKLQISCSTESEPVSFDKSFNESKLDWESRWKDAFTPHNKRYSGWLPTLVTADAKIRRVYYLALMSMLQMERTNLPKAKRCFVTAGPQWATTMEYFWDTSLFSTMYAWLEPKAFRENLERWLTIDVHSHYAIDYYSGQGVGPWYSANDLSLFTSYWNYMTVTGDQDFQRQMAATLNGWATYWKKLVRPGETLADYGENENILECGPEYVHMIPSLNAANVELMRMDARLEAKLGHEGSESLTQDAAKLERDMYSLYQRGQGVWATKHRDGKIFVARHIYDYVTVGQGLLRGLPANMKQEMTDFVKRELVVDGWIRAMSLSDPAAARSDRPDHGPKGSYCGWPAMAVLTMCLFDQFDDALALVQNCEKATWQGPFPQSFELMPDPRIAYRGGQDYNEPNGTAFAEAITRGFFGVDYNLDGHLELRHRTLARSLRGKLINVPEQGRSVTLTCGPDGVKRSE